MARVSKNIYIHKDSKFVTCCYNSNAGIKNDGGDVDDANGCDLSQEDETGKKNGETPRRLKFKNPLSPKFFMVETTSNI